MHRRFPAPWLLSLSLAALVASACAESYEKGGTAASLPLATGVRIAAVEMYQGVGIPLMKDGAAVETGLAPIVGGRPAFLRVFVEPDASFVPRDVVLDVVLSNDIGSAHLSEILPLSKTASTPESVASSLNLELPVEVMIPGISISVAVREVSPDAVSAGDTAGAIWPAEGAHPLEVEESYPPLKLRIVPVKYDADGSGRLPDISDAAIKDLFATMYPVTGVEVEVTEPMPYSGEVAASGGGWQELLTALTQFRSANGGAPDEYYFGLVNPADSFQGSGGYCNMGCVTGLSWQLTEAPSAANQVGSGIGFGATAGEIDASRYTAVHEVGHLHGLLHVNGASIPGNQCGVPDGIDPQYPYPTGSIGVWGYDPFEVDTDSAMKDPALLMDMMSYCEKVWISDYMSERLFERVVAISALGAAKAPFGASPREFLSIVFRAGGAAKPGPAFSTTDPVRGELRPVDLLDDAGNVLSTIDGVFVAYSDGDGGMIAFPKPAFEFFAARAEGLSSVPLMP